MAERRIVVTGMGTISPVGLSVRESWNSIISGRSGIRRLEPQVNSQVEIGGQVKGFEPEKYLPKKESSRIHPCAWFAAAATGEALKDSGIFREKMLSGVNPERGGVVIGTGIGGGSTIAEVASVIMEKGDDRIPTFSILKILPDSTASSTSRLYGLKGPVFTPTAACATGSMSITAACRMIMLKEADWMVAGASEAAIDPVAVGSFVAVKALSRRNSEPERASRPFDKDASGFVMAEGAGILVLEELKHAQGRKAQIYAEIAGFADTADAYHVTEPSGEGAVRSMRLALQRGKVKPEQVDYINAHGTSTPVGDPAELKAIKEVFGKNSKRLSISSTKSATGHMLGAAGAFEAIMAIMTIKEGIVPPTVNLENPIPEAEGLDLVPLVAKRKKVEVSMSNSFGFGGINSTLVFKKYK